MTVCFVSKSGHQPVGVFRPYAPKSRDHLVARPLPPSYEELPAPTTYAGLGLDIGPRTTRVQLNVDEFLDALSHLSPFLKWDDFGSAPTRHRLFRFVV